MALNDAIVGPSAKEGSGHYDGVADPTRTKGSAVTIQDVYDMMEKQRQAAKRAHELERARASARHTYTDDNGTEWTYVVLDGTDIRIMKCETTLERLVVPDEIDDKPVTSLAADSLASLYDVKEIICADGIQNIGLRAFLDCRSLKRLVLPKQCATLSAQWYRGSTAIEELVLPGLLQKIDGPSVDIPSLKVLVAGDGLAEIAPGTFEKLRLDRVVIPATNPALATDGKAIYSKDGAHLVAMAVHVSSYDVPNGCKIIDRKAFYSMETLEEITLPSTLEVLGGFCFGRTNISAVELPSGLRTIGEKAFFYCEKLEHISLNDGLKSLEDEAFSHSNVRELWLPASIEHIGKDIALSTKVTFSGPDATFRISPDSPTLALDEDGGLYRTEEDGKHFFRLMDPGTQRYKVAEGTVQIDEGSFTGHTRIQAVALPESVKIVGKGAFKGCKKLEECLVPPTLERIEDEAFLDTALTSFTIPAALTYLGMTALTTKGAHVGFKPSLRHIEVQEGNEKYYVSSGILCERYSSGRCRAVLFDGSTSNVVIPPETYTIGAYAFAGANNVHSISFSEGVRVIEICGLKIISFVENIHIDLEKPYQGHDHFDINFPQTDRGAREMQLALCVLDHVDIKGIFQHYDNTIANSSSASGAEGIDQNTAILYDQTKRIVARLKDPVYMTGGNKMMLESFIRNNILAVSAAVARLDDRAAIDDLFELGFLNKETVLPVIDRIGRLQDAAMTGYVLEKKKELFDSTFMDFDL
ncbi:MAG: leucine-rich repeat domain-containing protein [Coriobacteriia bacterium]|nr:leucine-rich repeat domain-containing protein [Coriobacteriia bacterium]